MTMPIVFPSGSLSPCTQPFPSKHAIFGVFIEILITTKPKQSMSFSMMQTANHKCMQGPGAGYRLHTKQALGFPSPHARAPLLTLASVNKMSILYGFSRLEDPNLVYTFSKSAEERYPWANLFLVVDICPAERFALQTLQTLLQLGRHVGALCIYVDLFGCTLIGHLLSLRPKNLWPGQP